MPQKYSFRFWFRIFSGLFAIYLKTSPTVEFRAEVLKNVFLPSPKSDGHINFPYFITSSVSEQVACENSRPSSLLARVAFRVKHHSGRSEEGRLFSQASEQDEPNRAP